MFRFALIGLVPIVSAVAGGAQSSTRLTEAEYLSALDESHPAVRASAEALARAEAGAREASTLDNPVLGGVREEPGGPVRETDVVLSWQVPDASRGPAIEARRREVEAARIRLGQVLLDHRLAMRRAYADWAVTEQRRAWLATQAERFESLADREADRAEKGEASGLEAHRLRLAATTLRSREALAVADRESARAAAARWVPDLPADARPVLPDLPEAPSLAGPDARVRAAAADLAAAESAGRAAGRFVASPEVAIGWKRQEVGPESTDGPIIGLAWSLPLFDRGQAARSLAEAVREAARARLELAEREASAERTAAERSYSQIRAALAGARQSLAGGARMLDGAEAAFRLGEASLTDLLETHRSAAEAELAVLELHQAALAAHRELERLAGPASPQPTFEPHDSIASPSQEDRP